MTGNPYHDADGKFSSKDESMKSYENADAEENADYEKLVTCVKIMKI